MLTSMKRSKPESSETEVETPEYPYGLSISLDDESMNKLGLGELPAVGDEMMVMAKVKVKSAGESEYEGEEKSRNVTLQITDMGLKEEEKRAADKMYGGNDEQST